MDNQIPEPQARQTNIPNMLVCSHFNDCCMHLVKFNLSEKKYQVLQTIHTTFANKNCETDLLAADKNGHIVATNYNQNTCSMYKYANDTIEFVKDLPYDAGNRVHGLRFVDKNTIAVTCRHSHRGIHFFDVTSFQKVALYSISETSAQDLCLLSDDTFAMITCFGTPTLIPKKIYASRVSLVQFNLKQNKFNRIADRDFDSSHFDNMAHYDGILYITDQYNNRVLKLNAHNLQDCGELHGYDFPHGIDVNLGIIAVTNYGNNTITIDWVE